MLGATAGFGVAGPWAWCRPPG
ncbi:hypothetical protein [Vulcanococcus sp.]